ncbi:MAG: DUF1016 family protein [Bacteroidales bacterium]|nr:DUF1016 family protein [Bacteroidales bacterium]
MNIATFDIEYKNWLESLILRYRQSQIKAAIKVNAEVLRFYWLLGGEITERQYDNKYGSQFYKKLSADLRSRMNEVKGLSESNIRYAKRFYCLYFSKFAILQQPAEKSDTKNLQQVAENFEKLLSIPWTHHLYIIDKVKGDADKGLYYVGKTLENNWSRAVLLNMLSTDIYEREGKAITNFSKTLSLPDSDLAQQITKDPYNFDFIAMTENYVEAELKQELVNNISKMMLELGRGFAYMGHEVRLKVGDTEVFLDLLFYCVPLHRYVVVEVKTEKFNPSNVSQLGTYVVAVNHQLNVEGDNPAIGLLICKEKDSVLARYALESSSQPLGISEYELSKVYPKDFKSTLPTIEEIENNLNDLKTEK